MYIFIYIYREREGENEGEGEMFLRVYVQIIFTVNNLVQYV